MSIKLNEEIKQDIIEHFEYHDVDDMHRYSGAEYFLQNFNQPVDVQELLEFINKDLSQWIEIPERLLTLLNIHYKLEVNLGEALHATQFRLLKPELELACSPSLGVRLITALASKNAEILKLMMVDPCYLVRLATYENKSSDKNYIEDIQDQDPYFREFTSDYLTESISNYEDIATLESCGCSADQISDFIHDKYSEELLELPPIAHQFEQRMRYFGDFNFGTQPLPSPMEDYRFRGIIDYIQGPIPDQFVVNYAGHGIASYSLNFRYALGELAVLMQVGYGGAYGDREAEAKLWDDCVNHIGNIMLLNPEDRKEGLWQRKFIILFSNFRLESHIQLHALRGDTWTEVPLVKSWDDLYEFFSFWGNTDALRGQQPSISSGSLTDEPKSSLES